ncbi:LysR family transcriptional regulator [Streptomyces sp. NPDC023838]|uniref:LysR family transcriptional regulator n=1 Tax=Streptomyces sp. NPDC023838 TaxID=3154325 RepID=UPI0033F70D64
MDPHLLRTFVTVSRCGSFSQAARELGYTQSAVSQHIAALENDLGAILLLRRPVTATNVGVRLLEHAGPLLLRLDAARADIARLTAAPAARIVIGVSPLALSSLFTRTLADLRQTHPRLEVKVRVLGREDIPREVATSILDLGLIDGMAAPNDPLHLPDIGPLTAMAVAQQPLAVALPTQHPLSRRAGLRLVDLTDARWIDAPGTAISLSQLRTVSGSDGYRTSLRYEGTDIRGLIALVTAGHGLALLPQQSIDGMPGISAVPLAAPRLVHRTEALYSSTLDGPQALLAAALTAATG